MAQQNVREHSRSIFGLVSLGVALMVVLCATPASATSIVIPGSNAATEGNSNNVFPFDISPLGINSQRYEEVYGASAFGPDPVFIDALLFRPDGIQGRAFSSTLSNVQIDLSTTTAAVDALSPTFANNVGANDTIVFSGALTLSSANTGPAGGPKAFDILITLTTPFLYNPSLGNLLLDVRNFGGGTTTPFDAQNTLGDAVSRVFTNTPSGVNDATGVTSTLALITEFQTRTVAVAPEPTSLLLLGTGLIGAGVRRYRRRRPGGQSRGFTKAAGVHAPCGLFRCGPIQLSESDRRSSAIDVLASIAQNFVERMRTLPAPAPHK